MKFHLDKQSRTKLWSAPVKRTIDDSIKMLFCLSNRPLLIPSLLTQFPICTYYHMVVVVAVKVDQGKTD